MSRRTRSFFVPEVVQTSAMDCGPAALAAALRGFGVGANFGRLREACQTTVDGTSINTLEAVARQLGLTARQIVLPPDVAFDPASQTLPAIVVTVLPGGAPHFVLVWGRVGRWLQIMDPATGRRWVREADLMRDLYSYASDFEESTWLRWARSDAMAWILERRLRQLGVREAHALVDDARASTRWRAVAELDAASRMIAALDGAGAFRNARARERTLRVVLARVVTDERVIPDEFWMTDRVACDGRIAVRGAVLVPLGPPSQATGDSFEDEALDRSLHGAEGTSDFGWIARELLRDGPAAIAILIAGTAAAATMIAVEALLFRALLSSARAFSWGPDRAGALLAAVAFVFVLFLLEVPLAATMQRIGTHLEARLRVAYLEKLPTIGDRYFHSRLASDMAERAHVLHIVRRVPDLGAKLLRATLGLGFTASALAWVAPDSALIAFVGAFLAVAVPSAIQPLLRERDLRMRTHGAALTRFYLDALIGMAPIRAHGGERNVKREHESLLVEWSRAGVRLQRASAAVDALVGLAGALFAWCVVLRFVGHAQDASLAMLVAYWALRLPAYGDELAGLLRQVPALRNVLRRALELLDAPSEWHGRPDADVELESAPELRFENVTVRAGGAEILRAVDLRIGPKEHVAVVGPSGAGKSTLAGLLLGWHTTAQGRVLVNGATLDAQTVDALRRNCAWIDPEIRVWNESILANVRYGTADLSANEMACAIDRSRLREVLERAASGLQTEVGDGGSRLSGGEGQRLRVARALVRSHAPLVVMDEPFRGLDRNARRELLEIVRSARADSTLLCITHDIEETLSFSRVLVVEGGRVVEDAPPSFLANRPNSRFAALLEAERRVRRKTWESSLFRRVRLEAGRLQVEGAGT